jgi:hypothetical protein
MALFDRTTNAELASNRRRRAHLPIGRLCAVADTPGQSVEQCCLGPGSADFALIFKDFVEHFAQMRGAGATLIGVYAGGLG